MRSIGCSAINDGPYTLVGQGRCRLCCGNPVNLIRREDEALPMTNCTICYYAQTVGSRWCNARWCGWSLCIERKAPTLPKPRLSPPAAIGTAAAPKMKLTWMCSPQGVERFLITIKAKGGPAVQSALENASAYSLMAAISPALAGRQAYYLGADDDGKVTLPRRPLARRVNLRECGQPLGFEPGHGCHQVHEDGEHLQLRHPAARMGFPAEPPFHAEFDVQAGVTCVRCSSKVCRG